MKNLTDLYNAFLKEYDKNEINEIWKKQSSAFRHFWVNQILNDQVQEVHDDDIDGIVRILDKHGKGNTPQTHSIAKVMIPQGAWRRLFSQLNEDQELSAKLNEIFKTTQDELRAKAIDELFILNKPHKNNLTGATATAINCLLAAYDPFNNLSFVSLNDRNKLLASFGQHVDTSLSIGQQVVQTGNSIKQLAVDMDISTDARTLSAFFYAPEMLAYWRNKSGNARDIEISDDDIVPDEPGSDSDFVFQLEKHLEDFLIKNWERTELGRDYDLLSGEQSSQQYRTDIGPIDILAQEKKTGRYVIIELKKEKTSDRVIGQIARYMGWIDEHLSPDQPSKGIVIASRYDKNLKYAVKRIKDVEVYVYKVDFHLEEHKV